MKTESNNTASTTGSVDVDEILGTFTKINIELADTLDSFIKAWVEGKRIPYVVDGKVSSFEIINLQKKDDLFVVDCKDDSKIICLFLNTAKEQRSVGIYKIDRITAFTVPSIEIFLAISIAYSKAEEAEMYRNTPDHRS